MKKIMLAVLLGTLPLFLTACHTSETVKDTTMNQAIVSIQEGISEAEIRAESAPWKPELAQALSKPMEEFLDEDDERFDLAVKEVSARAFFMELAKGTPYNMVIHPSVEGTITLDLNQVNIREVLETVRNIYGYEYKESSVGFEIFPIQLQTKVYHLDYLFMTREGRSSLRVSATSLTGNTTGTGSSGNSLASPGNANNSGGSSNSSNSGQNATNVSTESSQNIWDEISKMLTSLIGTDQGQKFSVSPQSGIVMVKAMPQELRQVEEFLSRIQNSLNRQVLLEAKIIEISLTDGTQQGINWSSALGAVALTQMGGGSTLTGAGINSATTVSNAAGETANLRKRLSYPQQGDTTLFGGVFSAAVDGNFAVLLEFLNSQGNVQVLSSPRISALNNQKAVIKIGKDEYFVTDVSSNTNSSGGGSNTTANVDLQPFFSGIALDVTPFIDDDNNVTLHVHPTITSVTEIEKTIVVNGENQVLPLAQSTIRESDSIIRARSGQIVVIGGLMRNETIEVSTSVPYLDQIPLLGHLFKNTRQERLKSELVILLKPVVVSRASNEFLLQDANQRLQRLNRGFTPGSKPKIFGKIHEETGAPQAY